MKQQDWRDFLRMRPFLRPYAWQLGLIIMIGLAGSLLGLAQPLLSKYLVDKQPDWPAQTLVTGFPWFDHDGSTASRQLHRVGSPQSAAAARDNGDPIFEVDLHV